MADVSRMALASGLAARLEADRVPVDAALSSVFRDEALELALTSGEEYHLVYAAPPAVMERTLARLPGARMIGRGEPGRPGHVRVEGREGREVHSSRRGWDHFRPWSS